MSHIYLYKQLHWNVQKKNTAITCKKTSQVAELMIAYCHYEWQYANVQFLDCVEKSQQLLQVPQRSDKLPYIAWSYPL